MNNLELDKIHEQKYLKYKAKYLNAVKIMYGGANLNIEYIYTYIYDIISKDITGSNVEGRELTNKLIAKYEAWFIKYPNGNEIKLFDTTIFDNFIVYESLKSEEVININGNILNSSDKKRLEIIISKSRISGRNKVSITYDSFKLVIHNIYKSILDDQQIYKIRNDTNTEIKKVEEEAAIEITQVKDKADIKLCNLDVLSKTGSRAEQEVSKIINVPRRNDIIKTKDTKIKEIIETKDTKIKEIKIDANIRLKKLTRNPLFIYT